MATKTRRTAREIRLEAVVALQNELNALNGEAPVAENYVNRYNDYKLCEIGTAKEQLIKKIDEIKQQNAIEVFLAGEGKDIKKEIDKRIATGREQIKAIRKSLITLAELLFDTPWIVENTSISYGHSSITISQHDEDDKCIVGTELVISYEYDTINGSEEFQTNICTTGSFDLLDNAVDSRVNFYIELGKLLQNKKQLEYIKAEMKQLVESYKRAENMIDKAKEVEKDPFSNKFEET